jgi:hypothetical protein
MIVMEDGGSDFRVPHKGDVIGKVIEGTYTVLGESSNRIDQIEGWQQLRLTHDEQMAMAEAAHVVRFGDAEGNVDTPFEPRQLLRPRRQSDIGDTLWLTHNRLQENVIKGGLHAWTRDANGRPRRAAMRETRAIDGDVKLNRALWLLSHRMAELKAA